MVHILPRGALLYGVHTHLELQRYSYQHKVVDDAYLKAHNDCWCWVRALTRISSPHPKGHSVWSLVARCQREDTSPDGGHRGRRGPPLDAGRSSPLGIIRPLFIVLFTITCRSGDAMVFCSCVRRFIGTLRHRPFLKARVDSLVPTTPCSRSASTISVAISASCSQPVGCACSRLLSVVITFSSSFSRRAGTYWIPRRYEQSDFESAFVARPCASRDRSSRRKASTGDSGSSRMMYGHIAILPLLSHSVQSCAL